MKVIHMLCILFFSYSLNAQSEEMLEGKWNMTFTMVLPGSAQTVGPYTKSDCFTKDDLKDPSKLFSEPGLGACEYLDKQHEGNRFNFRVKCVGSVPINGSGNVEYSDDSYQGQLNLQATIEGVMVVTQSLISGVRVGSCGDSLILDVETKHG